MFSAFVDRVSPVMDRLTVILPALALAIALAVLFLVQVEFTDIIRSAGAP